jgi:hypothetical protein
MQQEVAIAVEYDVARTTYKIRCPTATECNVTRRLKAGIVEPEETVVAVQRLGKLVLAAMNTLNKAAFFINCGKYTKNQ